MDITHGYHSYVVLFYIITYIVVIKSVVPDVCLSSFNGSDCHAEPRTVFSYYKLGSRCEMELWRGCPTLNSFLTEYRCIQRCIFTLETDPSRINTKTSMEIPFNGSYHDIVGIPEAARIKKLEISGDYRIIGGFIDKEPYLIGILITLQSSSQVSMCSAAMVSRTRALTAAHCWRHGNKQALYFKLVFGSECLHYGGHRVVTKEVDLHPKYDAIYLSYDIAIIRFPLVMYTDTIRRIFLPRRILRNNSFIRYGAKASGYGYISDDGDNRYDGDSYSVKLRVISNKGCKKAFMGLINDASLCTSGRGGVGTCGGDSGGPLAITNNSKNILIGITNYGDKLCETTKPSVYTRVTHVMPWIRRKMKDKQATLS